MMELADKARARASVMGGMTLIEAMLTLTVLAILAGIAVPSFASLIRRTQTTSYFNLLIGTLYMARTAAINEHATVLVCPSDMVRGCTGSLNWHEGWIVVLRPGPRGQPDAGSRILSMHEPLPEGVRIESSVGRRKVQYRPDGSARGSNLSLRFCAREQPTAVTALVVNNGGRARKVVGRALADLPSCRR